LADQVLKDRKYLITKHYFLEIADGTFRLGETYCTWKREYSWIFSKKLTYLPGRCGTTFISRQVLLLMADFCLDTTLACVFNNPPHLGDWNIRCPTDTQGSNLGFCGTSSAPVNRSTPSPGSSQSSVPLSYHKK
jgi:hypothetical protein